MKAVPRILELRALLWQDHAWRQNGHGTIYAAESYFCKEKVVRTQLRGDGRKLRGIGVVD